MREYTRSFGSGDFFSPPREAGGGRCGKLRIQRRCPEGEARPG